MSLLPLPPPIFGSDVEGHRYWLESALFECRQASVFYASWSPSYRQLSCLTALLTCALRRLDWVCHHERPRTRSGDYQVLLWRKLTWLYGKYERVRCNLIDLALDGQLTSGACRASASDH